METEMANRTLEDVISEVETLSERFNDLVNRVAELERRVDGGKAWVARP